MFDMDVGSFGPENPHYNHWIVINIPGNDVKKGNQVNAYMPSFTFDYDEEKGVILKNSTLTHRYLWLVYEQPNGELNLEKEENICSPKSLTARTIVSCNQ